MIESASSSELRSALEQHLQETRGHVTPLGARIRDTRGRAEGPIECRYRRFYQRSEGFRIAY
jgi:ferritin-like metal-binding protein YciE